MTRKFTPNDLVRFIYKETSGSETLAIMDALNEDPQLADIYEDLIEGYVQMPKVSFSPSNATLKQILGYSKETSYETQF